MQRFFKFEMTDPEFSRWTDVMPGDMVQAPWTRGWHFRDRNKRNPHKGITFMSNPLLVLARVDGPPDEKPFAEETNVITFLCLSPSKGVVFIVKDKAS